MRFLTAAAILALIAHPATAQDAKPIEEQIGGGVILYRVIELRLCSRNSRVASRQIVKGSLRRYHGGCG